MANGLNKCMFIGNVGRDPEMRYTPGGAAVTSFSLAVGRSWSTPDGERKDETEWLNVVAWNKLAETCNSLVTKGRKVYIEGRLQTRSWEQDGQKKYRTEVIATTMLLLDSRQRDEGRHPSEGTGDDRRMQGRLDEYEGAEPDDIPL